MIKAAIGQYSLVPIHIDTWDRSVHGEHALLGCEPI